jgi:hypothetical protein
MYHASDGAGNAAMVVGVIIRGSLERIGGYSMSQLVQ